MFDRLATHYDRVNRILSFGVDTYWRRKALKFLPKDKKDLFLVDLASGTGDQILALRKHPSIGRFLGLDLSEKMLQIGKAKIKRAKMDAKATLMLGNAASIPLSNHAADLVTMSFGIRNMTHPKTTLSEIKRILKPGGTTYILEFSLPENRLIRSLYLPYLRNVLPRLGKFFSKDKEAYRYLNETIEDFPSGDSFLEWMREAGFSDCKKIPMTFGVITLYLGRA